MVFNITLRCSQEVHSHPLPLQGVPQHVVLAEQVRAEGGSLSSEREVPPGSDLQRARGISFKLAPSNVGFSSFREVGDATESDLNKPL